MNQFDRERGSTGRPGVIYESWQCGESCVGEPPHPDLAENINNKASLLMESGPFDGSEVRRYLESPAMDPATSTARSTPASRTG
ncbi:hypothetical protein [Rhodoferax sp.]|uniref:hypothetical protein n=1 Tax=Rhodoferax sp. TaxID=50421 RepID=UPI002ACED6E9|nr:hypothetical protein [Rhodoferax sp.]MDZ7921177.1 hypothetical protein [Rhodoferax sp.]